MSALAPMARHLHGALTLATHGHGHADDPCRRPKLPGAAFWGVGVTGRGFCGGLSLKDGRKFQPRAAGKRHVMEAELQNPKAEMGACGSIFEDVPHLTDWLPDLPTFPNPLKFNPAYSAVKQYFVDDDDVVAKDIVVTMENAGAGLHFRRAGPRDKIYFRPEEVKACIVTCGGLCPGINTVIREIVSALWYQYSVRDIYGIDGGYRGFYARNTLTLNPKVVNDIHKRGGTILGTSRGGHDTMKIVDSIENRGINQVYIIGGDGTHKGAKAIHEEIIKRGLKVVVAGIPKTIDNDIDVIDKSFGFDTAVEEAQRAINAAHVEAESTHNGVGVVKLMGRYSGYIAMYATLASRDVDCCLIPEVPFFLEGGDGLYEFVYRRLKDNGHMVLVVAEGSGQELIAESLGSLDKLSDASGNRLLLDVGLWLCQRLKDHFLKVHKESITLKYIDPTYMIRAVPSIASDNVYCTLLAHSVIHGAMAGFCGFTAGPVNNRHCYIPISRAVEKQRHVNTSDRMWARLLSSTHQPNFLRYESVLEEQRDQREKDGKGHEVDLDQHLSGLTASHSLPLAPQSNLKASPNGSSATSSTGNEDFGNQVGQEASMSAENATTQNAPAQTTPTSGDPMGMPDETPQI